MLRQALENYFNRRWYESEAKHWLWSPLSRFYERKIQQKRQNYLDSCWQSEKGLPPVLVVGNITVGGTGKTPLVIYLIENLEAKGLKVAVISRGYGGVAESYPAFVGPQSTPEEVGDEPYMIYQRTGVTIVVDPDRNAALKQLAKLANYDVVISDDGLQHYKLNRQFEIVVVDGERGFGNGACLPLGPLREPLKRLKAVDAVVVNGSVKEELAATLQAYGKTAYTMKLAPQVFKSLQQGNGSGVDQPLDAFIHSDNLNAIAAIGNPQRFFSTLKGLGIQANCHAFPDHHLYSTRDVEPFRDSILLMTEKDAVKVRGVLPDDQISNAYFLSISAELDQVLINGILSRFKGE